MLLLSTDNIKKCLTCAHPGCQWPNVCHVASVSTNTVTPGILSVLQHALTLPSEQRTDWWLGKPSTSSGFHLKSKEKQGVYKEWVHWTRCPVMFPRNNNTIAYTLICYTCVDTENMLCCSYGINIHTVLMYANRLTQHKQLKCWSPYSLCNSKTNKGLTKEKTWVSQWQAVQ